MSELKDHFDWSWLRNAHTWTLHTSTVATAITNRANNSDRCAGFVTSRKNRRRPDLLDAHSQAAVSWKSSSMSKPKVDWGRLGFWLLLLALTVFVAWFAAHTQLLDDPSQPMP
jgi:hypothetical protein